jgi:peptide/nickel transport system ATP-binding protein
MTLLAVEGLRIEYPGAAQPAVDGLDLAMTAGDALGLVGESGSGKSQTALAIMGLLPRSARVTGSVRFDGCELLGQDEKMLNRFRARRIAMVFQDPQQALNPYLTIGRQLGRVLREHKMVRRDKLEATAIGLLERVELPEPERQLRSFPHQLSGGMRQRAMIALALAAGPDVLIADEPTTALDVTVQAQILALLRRLRADSGIALLLITHDLGVIAQNSERMVVMREGRVLERGTTRDVFRNATHAHTRKLIAAAPRLDTPVEIAPPPDGAGTPLLEVNELRVSFGARRARRLRLTAVAGINLFLRAGETLAIVGESGSGKTTLARAIVGLVAPDAGEIRFRGARLAARVQARRPEIRRELQMVFQDPVASLDPAMTVEAAIAEPLGVHYPGLDRAGRAGRIRTLLARTGLPENLLGRYPHQLSGGQAQRVAIARALAPEPRVLVCDEAVAALDGTVRAEVLELLRREQARTGLALIFITHDLGVVRQVSHRVLVMHRGRVCEEAGNPAIFEAPAHPYTRALLDAVPVPDPAAPDRGSVSAPPPAAGSASARRSR